jgi:dTDP-4-dehydrorhamnose reductase
MIQERKPWAIINTSGYVRVDDAENDADNCFLVNTTAPTLLSKACNKYGIQFVTFSSDLVFDGRKNNPYLESDIVSPLNIYGQSKAMAEEAILQNNSSALIIRTSAFFGPWDQHNFVYSALRSFTNNQSFTAADDVVISPTYVPDLVHTSLDLLMDEVSGIWNISNKGSVSWAMLASEVANRSGYNNPKNFEAVPLSKMGLKAVRPAYSALTTEKGFELPSWDHALERYFREQELLTL